MDIDVDSKLEEAEFWSNGDSIQPRCFICGQEDTEERFNIFETKTSRDHKLAVCLATALQKDIVTDAVGSEVICKLCQNLVEKAEHLKMQLDNIHNELRSLHFTTMQMLESDDIKISQIPSDESSQIMPASPEPRKKPRKDQHVPRKELPPLITPIKIDYKRKRGRPVVTESKEFKNNSLKSNNKPFLKPPILVANSHVSMPINIEEADLFQTPIADKQCQQDNISKSINQKYEASIKKKKSAKKTKICMKSKQDELNKWLEQRSCEKVNKINQQGQEKVKENKQEEEQQFLKNCTPNIKKIQKKKIPTFSANSLQNHKQSKLAKKLETPQTTTNEHQSEMEGKIYKVHQVPNSTNAALVLKFKKIRTGNVNYVETFDSDSDNEEDHSEDKDPNFKLPVNRFGLRFKRTKYLRKHLAGKEPKKVNKGRKKKLLKQKKQLRMDVTRTVLEKENTCHNVEPASDIINNVNKSMASNSEPEGDQDRTNKENKKRTYQPEWLNAKRLKVCLTDIYKHDEEVPDEFADTRSLDIDQTYSINDGNSVKINPYWVSSDYSFHEELIIKDEIDDSNNDLGEIYSSSDTCGITHSEDHNFNQINIKTEIVESENECDDNNVAKNEYNFSQVPVKCESVQIKNELLDSMCAKMELMFPCSNRNSYSNYCNGEENKNSTHQIWSTRPIKLSPQKFDSDKEREPEYFCDICGDDFNSVEKLKNHIEVDHFSPNY